MGGKMLSISSTSDRVSGLALSWDSEPPPYVPHRELGLPAPQGWCSITDWSLWDNLKT